MNSTERFEAVRDADPYVATQGSLAMADDADYGEPGETYFIQRAQVTALLAIADELRHIRRVLIERLPS